MMPREGFPLIKRPSLRAPLRQFRRQFVQAPDSDLEVGGQLRVRRDGRREYDRGVRIGDASAVKHRHRITERVPPTEGLKVRALNCFPCAAGQLDRMADELTGSRARLDLLESLVDILLGELEGLVVVVDVDRHILGMSRAAVERFDGPAIGKPLTSVMPEPLDDAVQVYELPGDATVLVVPPDE